MLPSATSPLRDTTLTFCATSPQQLICRPTVHSFPSNFLDLGHRWFEREDNDVLPLAATVCTHIKLNSALAPDPDPFPDPQQPARPLADFADGHRQTPARRQPHNAPSLHTAWTIQSTSSLELTRRQLGSKSSSSPFFLCAISASNRACRRACGYLCGTCACDRTFSRASFCPCVTMRQRQ